MQRYFAIEKRDNHLYLKDDDIYHINTVMRMKENNLLEIVYLKKLYIAKIIDKNYNYFEIVEEVLNDNKNGMKINLIMPLLKENKMDLIFQKGTELGIEKFTIIHTNRSIIKLDDRRLENKITRWSKICKEASEQSKRLDIPNIYYCENTNELSLLEGIKIVCMPTSTISIKNHLKKESNCGRINVVFGPEGGLTNEEEKKFQQLGFTPVNLGTKILRTETVPIFIASIIDYEYME